MTIHEKIEKAKKKWKLSNSEAIYETSDKAVYSALSPEYKDVILKISQNTSNLYHEYNVLQQFPEKYCCKVYEYDEKAPMFLEERIQPGTKQHIYSVAMKKVC